MARDDIIKKGIVMILVVGLFVLSFLVLKAVIFSIIIALLFAYIFQPIYKFINKKVKHPNISTSLLIIALLLIIAVPLAFLTPILIRQTFDTYNYFQTTNVVSSLQDAFPNLISEENFKFLTVNLNNILGKFFTSVINSLAQVIVNIPNLLLQFAVFLFTFFFATRDAEKLKRYASKLSPFSISTEKKFLDEFRHITNAIIYGQVLIGFVQAIALGTALFFLGVDKTLILTVITFIVSIIPVLGSWLVWLPIGIVLIISGHVFSGVFLLLYGGIVVSSIDNVMRPLFLSYKSNLPISISIVGIIGGLYYFGLTGIVLGPLILAYLLIIIEFYKEGKLDDLFKKEKR